MTENTDPPDRVTVDTDETITSISLVSLFEGNFSIDWIEEITGFRATRILAALETEVAANRLTRQGPGIYTFCKPAVRKKLQDGIPPIKQQALHQQIAAVLMRDLPDDEEKTDILSHHLLHIKNDLVQCRCLATAGDINHRKFNTEQAFQCYAKVLADLSGLSGTAVDELFTETAIKYSKLSTARHDTASVLDILNEAHDRALRLENKPFQALLEMHIAKNEWLRARYTRALKHFDQGWSMAKAIGDARLLRSATTFSTFFLYWQGRFKEAVQSYEKSVADVEKHPQDRFPLLAAITVGYCYAQIGQVTQGLGMLDSIRTHCLDRGDPYLAAYATGNMGDIMLNIGRVDDAVEYLQQTASEAARVHNDWVWINGRIMLAYACYLKGEKKRCIKYLREFLRQSRQVQATVHPYPYLMALTWGMEQGNLPRVQGLSLASEVHRKIRGKNLYMKGMGYRYLAHLQRHDGQPPHKVKHSLDQSVKWTAESGHAIGTAKSQLELARVFLSMGEEARAKELAQTGSKVLSAFDEALVPDDLRCLFEQPPKEQQLFKEILKLGQEVVSIRNNKDLVQHSITTVNRLTGAERGAIFLLDEYALPSKLQLRGSKNLTSAQIDHPEFASSMKLIEEVARTGQGRIMETTPDSGMDFFSNEHIRSRICVPMIFQDKLVGVLYHDNRLLSSAFQESDLELLAYFAALAAFALDNARAYQEIQRLNRKLSQEKQYYEEEHIQRLHFDDIIGRSRAIEQVLAQAEQVSRTETTVLITGETGVGKELVARAIHRLSPRKDKPFIRVQCSALPENLIPSELFGHEKGAFTGATARRIGRFELADTGSLFLDEMGDLSGDIQTRLLRVLQTREFERVGGTETLSSDFRLIAATNRNLENEVRIKRFRADLYYRLNVFPIVVPPLRERKEDIPMLAHHFLKLYSFKMGKAFKGIPEADMDRLSRYDWPGNIRELENVIERGCILSTGRDFQVPALNTDPDSKNITGRGVTLKAVEADHIRWALEKTGWKVRGIGGAAELLDLHPSTLAFRMKKLSIRRPNTLKK